MSRFNKTPSKEYSQFVQAVKDYAESEHEPGEDVYRALADALSENLREGFKNYWGVEVEADGPPCLRRVVTGADSCECNTSWKNRELEAIGESDEPPHSAPHSDHAELWLSEEGEAVLYSMHISAPEHEVVSKTAAPDEEDRHRNGWFDIIDFASSWGLEVGVTPWSHYHAFSRVNVVLYSPEWARSR